MRVLLVILVCLFAVACGPTAEVFTTPSPTPSGLPTGGPIESALPTPLTDETPGPTTPGTTAPPGTGFQPLTGFPAGSAIEIEDVTATPGGFMAIGYGGLDGETFYGRRQGIVWTSADGINWSQSVDATLRNVSPERIVVRGADYFMSGYLSACPDSDVECTDVPQAGNAIWHSTDGRAWQMLTQLADMQYGLIDEMIVAADRLVVFGSSADDNQTATVWQSTDGATWSSSTDLAELGVVSAMTYGNGLLTALGTRYVAGIEDVVLTGASSVDGATFTPATLPERIGAGISDVVLGANGFAAVGYQTGAEFDLDGVGLFSADGRNWTDATNSDGSWSGSGLSYVGALPAGGYVAVGFTPHQDDLFLQDGAAWRSVDGTDWTSLVPLEGAFTELTAAALGEPGMVVFAIEQSEDDDGNVTSIIYGWFASLAALGG